MHKILFAGVLLGLACAGVGCANDPTNVAQNKKTTYYHDKRTTTGSNIPQSYHDSGTDAAGYQGQLDTEELQQFQNQAGVAHSGGR